jgi:hypothetical protein
MQWTQGAILLLLASGAFASSYLCPRANVLFLNTTLGDANSDGDVEFSGTGGGLLSFPSRLEEIPERGTDWDDWGIELRPCSTAEFLCRRVIQSRRGDPKVDEYTLAIPRVLRPGQEYAFESLSIVTQSVAPASSSTDRPARINVTIMQRVDGKERLTRLTIEQSRGVIYWDGFRFGPSESGSGEMCVLRLGKGFFADAEIRQP